MQGNDYDLNNGKKKEVNDIGQDELIFDNFSIGNATLAAGIDNGNSNLNEGIHFDDTALYNASNVESGVKYHDSYSVPNATLAAGIVDDDSNLNVGIHFDDTALLHSSTNVGPKVKFYDSYSVPNATLAAGINYDDTFDTSAICKSMEYYNNIFNSGSFSKTHQLPPNTNFRNQINVNHRPRSIMDYMSRSHPLNGGSNLLAEYLKFHKIDDSEPSTSNNESPVQIQKQGSSIKSSYSVTSSIIGSPKSTHSSIIFDPNINTIPSYKGKKSHYHRRPSSSRLSSSHPERPIGMLDLHPMTTTTQELPLLNTKNDDENDDENEPLMMKTHHRKLSYTSNKSEAIDIQSGSPMKKATHIKRRSSRPPAPSPIDSFYGSYTSSKFSTTPLSSTMLAKTSQYIPDASLPYLVKTIDSHLINTDDNEDSAENIDSIYNLKGGDVARDIYNFNSKIKRTISNKRSKSEPNLYELNKRNENDFNISDISIPGGFRREFISSNAKKQGKTPPNWITSNFIDFLALYGHYAGDDDFDEDYMSEGYDTDGWDELSDNGSEIFNHHHNYNIYNKYYDDDKMKLFDSKSSFEVIPDHDVDKSKISIEIENMTENTPLLADTSQSSLNKYKNKKHKKNNSSTQTGTASEGKTMFLLLKAFIGTGILFLPKAFSNGGMIFSLISLAFSGWLTYFTMILLIRCSEKFGGSYGDIGKQLFGKPFKIMIQSSIALTQSGFCCAYIIFVLQSVQSIVSTISNGQLIIPDWAIIAAQVLIYIPLSWIRKIQNFSVTSLIADVFILIGLLYIISSDLVIVSSEGPSTFSLFNSEKFPLFLGTAIYAFEGIGLIIPLQRSMREPEKFPKVLKNSMYIIFVAMFIVGGLSYYIFGDEVNTIIFMNVFPDSTVGTIVRALYTLAIVFSFPLTCYSGIHIVEPLFIPRRRPFKSFSLKRKRKANQTNYASINQRSSSEMLVLNNNDEYLVSQNPKEEGEKGKNGLTPNSSYSSLPNGNHHHRKRDTGKNSKIIKWMKNMFRTVFVSCLGLIAYYGAANLDNFVSLIGSFCCIPLMFIYPALLHYSGVAEKFSDKLTDILIIIFGIVSTVWITKLSLDDWK